MPEKASLPLVSRSELARAASPCWRAAMNWLTRSSVAVAVAVSLRGLTLATHTLPPALNQKLASPAAGDQVAWEKVPVSRERSPLPFALELRSPAWVEIRSWLAADHETVVASGTDTSFE